MQNYKKYKNIIFDFGGVILNIDPEKSLKGFIDIGLCDTDVVHNEFQDKGIFSCLERGEISPVEFRTELRKHFNREVTDDDIDKAWNAMLLDLPKERLNLLEKLKKSHRLFLLSNTNIIHWETYMAYIYNEYGVNLSDFFEKDFYSHNMGLRKPDLRIYQQVLKEKSLNPAETLFIDDTLINVEAAKKLGIHTHHLKPDESILDLF